MQVSKLYTGEVTLESAAEKREYSYGYSKGTISVYPSKVDTLNGIIAQFLRTECGVDAWYGQGSASDYDFLWIYGVPFLFGMTGTSNAVIFYQPMGGPGSSASVYYETSSAPSISLFSSVSGDATRAVYSFGLVFAGNPSTGFCLRFKPYFNPATSNPPNVSSTLIVRFIKCENIINGGNSVIWSARNISSQGKTSSPMFSGFNGIDLNSRGIVADSYSKTLVTYTDKLYTNIVHRTANEGALPLVPLLIGPYRADGMYLRPVGFGLPAAMNTSTEVQAEITIGGRSFLVTCSDAMSTSAINMGLIETT